MGKLRAMAIAGMRGVVGGVAVGSVPVVILCFSHPLTTKPEIHPLPFNQLAPELIHQLGLITNTWTVNNHKKINCLAQKL